MDYYCPRSHRTPKAYAVRSRAAKRYPASTSWMASRKTTHRSKAGSLKNKAEVAPQAPSPNSRVIVDGFPAEVPWWCASPLTANAYWRIPVTALIPLNLPDIAATGSKVHVRGVWVRFDIVYAISCELFGVCYPALVQRDRDPVPVNGAEDDAATFQLGVQEPSIKGSPATFRLMNLDETGIVSKDGPFALRPKKEAAVPALNSNTRTPFASVLSTGPGAPIGKAQWKDPFTDQRMNRKLFYQKFKVGLPRASLGNQPYLQTDGNNLAVYFDINKDVDVVDRAKDGAATFDPPWSFYLASALSITPPFSMVAATLMTLMLLRLF